MSNIMTENKSSFVKNVYKLLVIGNRQNQFISYLIQFSFVVHEQATPLLSLRLQVIGEVQVKSDPIGGR